MTPKAAEPNPQGLEREAGLESRERSCCPSRRDGPSGRRAVVIGGPDVWEVVGSVVGSVVGGDVVPAERVARAVELFSLRPEQVEAALAYYAEFTDEINGRVAANAAAAAEAEALWRRRQDLLAG